MTSATYIGPTFMASFTWSAPGRDGIMSRMHPRILENGTKGRYKLRGFKLREDETEVAYFYPTKQPDFSDGSPACVALETAFLMRSEVDPKIIEVYC